MSVRILLVTHRYPPLGVTGVERLAEQTARALSASGHQVSVLTRNGAGTPRFPVLQWLTQDGVTVASIAGGGAGLGHFPHRTATMELIFQRVLVEREPEVVLVSHLMNHSPGYVAIARRWGVPVAMELHDFFVACERAHLNRASGELCAGPDAGRACARYCFGGQKSAEERWALRTHSYREAVRGADAVVCPSEFVAGYFAGLYGEELPPVTVIGNGVDVAAARPLAERHPDRPLHLACVGAVAAHKGIHMVLDALRLARLPAVRVSLFGEVYPPYLRRLHAVAERLPRVDFHAYGRFATTELPLLLADVDALVVPSLVWETYSIAAREAFACGVPVVAARAGALAEAVRDGENGLLFEMGSAEGLAALLRGLDRDRPLLDSLREGIRPTDWISTEERVRRLESLLADLARRPPRPVSVAGAQEELAILRDALPEVAGGR